MTYEDDLRHAPPPGPPPTDWWGSQGSHAQWRWIEEHAYDLSWPSQKKLAKRAFDSEAELRTAVEKSLKASQRQLARSPEDRKEASQRGADTRKQNENEAHVRSRLTLLRENCRRWDAVHVGDAEIRSSQSGAVKRQTRAETSDKRDRGDLKPVGHCERCGESGRTDGHHTDYSRVEVAWLCIYCHGAVHLGELRDPEWSDTLGRRAAEERMTGRDLGDLSPAEQRDLAQRVARQIVARSTHPLSIDRVTSLVENGISRMTPDEIYDYLRAPRDVRPHR